MLILGMFSQSMGAITTQASNEAIPQNTRPTTSCDPLPSPYHEHPPNYYTCRSETLLSIRAHITKSAYHVLSACYGERQRKKRKVLC
jgi:hypothetical protein